MKRLASHALGRWLGVAPHAGAWIETNEPHALLIEINGRPPRGGVD